MFVLSNEQLENDYPELNIELPGNYKIIFMQKKFSNVYVCIFITAHRIKIWKNLSLITLQTIEKTRKQIGTN